MLRRTPSDPGSRLARHLEMVGFAGAPRRRCGHRPHRAGDGEFVLGDVAHDRIWSEEGSISSAECSVICTRPRIVPSPPQAVWQTSFLRPSGPGTVISHGDVAPWNVVVPQGQPVALTTGSWRSC